MAEIAREDGKDDVAVKHLTSLIQSGMAGAEDWNARGLSYYALQDYDKAADDFHMAALIAGSESIYWSNLGDARKENKEYAAAVSAYTIAIRKGSDTPELRRNRGWAHYQLDRYENALADYDKAIAMDGKLAGAFNERGLVRHAMEDFTGAVGDFDQSLKLNPDDAVVLTNRAKSHARLGDDESTLRDLDRAISLKPD